MQSNCIQITNISKRYKGAEADSLKKINLVVLEGDKYGILGPNGAGKTTLVAILCGIFPPSDGQIQYWENDLQVTHKNIRPKIGFMPQEYAFYQELSPVKNLEYFGALYNLSKTTIKKELLIFWKF